MDEADALLDVALEALDGGVQKGLLLVGDARQGVLGLLDTVGLMQSQQGDSTAYQVLEGRGDAYAKLDGDGEELNTRGLGNLITARYTGQVDVAGLDEVLLASSSLEHLLREAVENVSLLRISIVWSGCARTGSQRRPWTGWQSRHRPWP